MVVVLIRYCLNIQVEVKVGQRERKAKKLGKREGNSDY